MGIWIDSIAMIQLVAFRGIWFARKCASPKEQRFSICTYKRRVSSLSSLPFWRVRPVAGWGGRNGMQRRSAKLVNHLTLQGFSVRIFSEFTVFEATICSFVQLQSFDLLLICWFGRGSFVLLRSQDIEPKSKRRRFLVRREQQNGSDTSLRQSSYEKNKI